MAMGLHMMRVQLLVFMFLAMLSMIWNLNLSNMIMMLLMET